MNDTEMIECREPALQMQRLIAIMKRRWYGSYYFPVLADVLKN